MKSAKTKLTRTTGQLSLVALAILAGPWAMADDAGWYVGASGGPSRATIDDVRITNALIGSGATSAFITDDNRDNGYKLYGGYQFNRNIAVEGGYFDLGNFGFNATTIPTGTLSGNIKLKGINLDLVGTLPVTQNFSILGRIGVNRAQATDAFAGTGLVNVLNPNPSKRENNLKVGLGVQYAFNESLALRAELERYRINDAVGNKGDIDLATVGLIYRFGAKTPTPVVLAPAPAPVYVAPEPVAVQAAPVPPPAPAPMPPPMPAKVTFSADSLFDFDKATVKPAGQHELDKFAAELKGTRYDVISVTGHTDRIGTHAYNQKLSERRAEAVKTYLVSVAAIAPNKITAKGVDGSNPVTQPGDCKGKKASKALIACLQPDRRVEVEVSGTR